MKKLVNHCFTCIINMISGNELTVAEDDRHLREKQQSKIHFMSLEKLMKLVETLPAVSVSSVVKVNGYAPHTLIYYHSNFIKCFSTNFIHQRYLTKSPFVFDDKQSKKNHHATLSDMMMRIICLFIIEKK